MLVYCDFIADRIRQALVRSQADFMEPVQLQDVGRVQWDLDEQGSFRSTAKTILVTDGNGQRYQVTVEQL